MPVLIGNSRVKISNIVGGTAAAGVYTDTSDPISVPVGAPANAAFLNTSTGDVFQLGSNMQWSKVGNVQGPAGPPGTGLTDGTIEQIKALTATEVLSQVDPRIAALEAVVNAGPPVAPNVIAIDDNGDYYFNLTDISVPNVGTVALDDEGFPYIKI